MYDITMSKPDMNNATDLFNTIKCYVILEERGNVQSLESNMYVHRSLCHTCT